MLLLLIKSSAWRPFGDWCDDQSLGGAKKLVLILKVDIGDGDDAVVHAVDVVRSGQLLPPEVRH